MKVLASTVDQTKAPSLVITEILPDSANVDGSDAYEFIELYNNSNQDINLSSMPETRQTYWNIILRTTMILC